MIDLSDLPYVFSLAFIAVLYLTAMMNEAHEGFY